MTPTQPQILLTEEQLHAVDLITQWLKSGSRQEFRLGGYAGTGKTTIQKTIRENLDILGTRSVVGAFTGKACNVLQRKGLFDASTIHSMIYDCEVQKNGTFEFFLRSRLEGNPKLIIIDEASMISTELYRDLRSFNIPILFVGDPGQLEPVGDNPNLMSRPDFVLSKIHRQAETSPIIRFASEIRRGVIPKEQKEEGLHVRSKVGFDIPLAATFDQVICAKNKTRVDINRRFRRYLDKPIDKLQPEDKIIVLRNNMSFGVFNGMILFVDLILERTELYTKLDAHDEIGRKFSNLLVWNEPFTKDLPKEFVIPKVNRQQLVYCDWGYCITCHKSQGSEWEKVLLWDEWMPPTIWDMRRWRYTGITRASKELTHCL